MKLQVPHLKDILTAIDKIEKITSEISYNKFMNDYKLHDVVMYNFIVIGEASSRVSEDFKKANKGVVWHKLKGMRNHLAHSYDEIDYKIVWDTIKTDLQTLKIQIQIIVHNTN